MRQRATDDPISAARQRFFGEGKAPEGLVGASILRSWQRCTERGLDIVGAPNLVPMSSYELLPFQEQNETLRRLTRPEMESLRLDADFTESAVILTDASGLILDLVGNAAFADRASEVALQPGIPWSEAVTGTNAIGTALIERRPISVHGAEHFFEPHRILACAAAPIVDPQGVVVGALDVSGLAAIRHLHALGLVRLAVDHIEHRFFDRAFEDCMVMRFHTEAALIGTAKEAIMVFAGEQLIAANREALRLLDMNWSAINTAKLETIFERLSPSKDLCELRSRQGVKFIGRVGAPDTKTPASDRNVPIAIKTNCEPVFSEETKAALFRATRLLEADIPILVQGETGTGKEVFARSVHAKSARHDKPFIAVNCAALPESLIEAELFGYTDGAFTGARRQGHKGLLAQADRGILFLDEIGDMPLPLQARLLRVLQDKRVSPLGSEKAFAVDFALICATHRSLTTLVADGKFRQDLYFRIAQFVVELPSLRDYPQRLQIIRRIWRGFFRDDTFVPLSPEAESLLAAHEWPGNFRQLVSALRAVHALAEPHRPLDIAALKAEVLRNADGYRMKKDEPSAKPLADTTIDAMRSALEACNGNVSRAARQLGIDRSTLYRRVFWKND